MIEVKKKKKIKQKKIKRHFHRCDKATQWKRAELIKRKNNRNYFRIKKTS